MVVMMVMMGVMMMMMVVIVFKMHFSENNIFQAMDTNGDGEVRRNNVSLYYMLIIRSVNLQIKYIYLASKYITSAFATVHTVRTKRPSKTNHDDTTKTKIKITSSKSISLR